jgi:hypothetical protein
MTSDAMVWVPTCGECETPDLTASYSTTEEPSGHRGRCPVCGATGTWGALFIEEDRLRTLRDAPGPITFHIR